MDFIHPEILSGELVPVLLGLSTETIETSRRMYQKYGVVSHVFAEKIPLSMRLAISMKFHRIGHTSNEQLMRYALVDFARQMGNADVILYLIPCTEAYANMIWHCKDELEHYYVVADIAEMERVWFGIQKKHKKGEAI